MPSPPATAIAGRAPLDLIGFQASLRSGRVFGTSGPLFTRFQVEGGEIGDLVGAYEGRVAVTLEVRAANFVPVDEVRLLVNGEVHRVFKDLPRGDAEPLDYAVRTTLRLERDAFLTAEAGAPEDVDAIRWAVQHPGLYSEAIAPGFVPQAFTNPIFVDVDGNGRFDAPGLVDAESGGGASPSR